MSKLDLALLENKFNLALLEPDGAVHAAEAAVLLSPENMRMFLAKYTALAKALDDRAAAAFFGNGIGALALAQQYMLSVRSVTLDLSLANIVVYLLGPDRMPRVIFGLHSWREIEAPVEEDHRQAWRGEVLGTLYGETLKPLFGQISATSGLPIAHLWGQLPTRFNSSIDTFIKEERIEETKQRLETDYAFLKHSIDPTIFGSKHSPFDVKIRLVEHRGNPHETVRIKNVCCLLFRKEDAVFCYTCPLLKAAERKKLQLEYRANAGLLS